MKQISFFPLMSLPAFTSLEAELSTSVYARH